jgi:tetratricopeptide (TPR) repeat protein
MKSRSCLFLLIFLILLAFSSLALAEDMREVTRKGIAAIKRGDYDTAVDLLTRAIDSDEFSDEDLVYIYYNRGLAYLHKGEWDNAIDDCTEAIALKEDFAWAYNNRGLA